MTEYVHRKKRNNIIYIAKEPIQFQITKSITDLDEKN